MIVYYVLLGLILVLGYFLSMKQKPNRSKIIYIVVVVGYMWFLSTYRQNIGWDYNSYINNFNSMKGLAFGDIFAMSRFEPGFSILTWIMGRFITSSVVMYGVYNLFIFIPLGYFIYRHCEDAWLSLWLYVTMAFLYTNMNFTRQSIACAITLCAYDFFIKKKTIPVLLLALLGGMFHFTALIIIPIYFIVHIKLTKVTGIIYGALVFFGVIFSKQLMYLITRVVFKDYWGERYIEQALGGVFLIIPLSVLIIAIALFFSWKKRDEMAGVMLNILIINATFWLFGSLRHMIIERFCMYTYIYTLAILPRALGSLKATPASIKERDELAAKLAREGGKQGTMAVRLDKLNESMKDHKSYYVSAIVAIVFLTFLYNNYGMNQGNFHNVFPFQSVLPWLQNIIDATSPTVASAIQTIL